jgi:hypothetical protein
MCFTLIYLTEIVVVFIVVFVTRANFFSTKHQVLKNSVYGQILIDFDAVSLKMLKNFEFSENEHVYHTRT